MNQCVLVYVMILSTESYSTEWEVGFWSGSGKSQGTIPDFAWKDRKPWKASVKIEASKIRNEPSTSQIWNSSIRHSTVIFSTMNQYNVLYVGIQYFCWYTRNIIISDENIHCIYITNFQFKTCRVMLGGISERESVSCTLVNKAYYI